VGIISGGKATNIVPEEAHVNWKLDLLIKRKCLLWKKRLKRQLKNLLSI
jgi:metal-dependent amidase/aminoacylase/carboxypeptidase family protein